ncbi:MAG: hypothetical protein JNN00_10130 [Chitinophagaceae bacterium]|nr:hypothetical protein [Chitinophagaceae bacterium]
MNAFCTIVSPDYLPFAKTLYSSIREFSSGNKFFVLLNSFEGKPDDTIPSDIEWLDLSDIIGSYMAKEIVKKYLHTNQQNEFRWALKPVLISYLLSKGIDKIIYTDADTYFVGNPGFLFDELEAHSVLLIPHWQSISVSTPESLSSILKGGYFNAGFIGASRSGLPAMNWWAEACHHKMEKSDGSGHYDDQKYLDIIPWEFKNVKVSGHKGCNLASWNIDTNKREMSGNKLLIEKEYEPVFIHFTSTTIHHIISGYDKLLQPYLEKYRNELLKHNTILENIYTDINFNPKRSLITKVKHKLLIRTKIKRLLYRIAENL